MIRSWNDDSAQSSLARWVIFSSEALLITARMCVWVCNSAQRRVRVSARDQLQPQAHGEQRDERGRDPPSRRAAPRRKNPPHRFATAASSTHHQSFRVHFRAAQRHRRLTRHPLLHPAGLSSYLKTLLRDRLRDTITEPRPLVVNLRAAFGRQPKARVFVVVRKVVGVSADIRHDAFVRVSVNGAFEETPTAKLQRAPAPQMAQAVAAISALASPPPSPAAKGESPSPSQIKKKKGGAAAAPAAAAAAAAQAPASAPPEASPAGAAARRDPDGQSVPVSADSVDSALDGVGTLQSDWEGSWDAPCLPTFHVTNWAKGSRVRFELFFWRSAAPHAKAGTHVLDLKSALENYALALTGARKVLRLPLHGPACRNGAFLVVEIGGERACWLRHTPLLILMRRV